MVKGFGGSEGYDAGKAAQGSGQGAAKKGSSGPALALLWLGPTLGPRPGPTPGPGAGRAPAATPTPSDAKEAVGTVEAVEAATSGPISSNDPRTENGFWGAEGRADEADQGGNAAPNSGAEGGPGTDGGACDGPSRVATGGADGGGADGGADGGAHWKLRLCTCSVAGGVGRDENSTPEP